MLPVFHLRMLLLHLLRSVAIYRVGGVRGHGLVAAARCFRGIWRLNSVDLLAEGLRVGLKSVL